ncbi:MAG: TRAP transporter large permease [Firmicutes bacterium]|nr:TRAP transporter large permease [Bacillota bacterium]
MDPILLSVIGIAVFLVLLFLGLHIGLSMAVVGFLGFALVRGFPAAFSLLKTTPFTTCASFSLSVIPLFVLMGQFAYYSGISGDLYNACYKWFGRVRGGLGVSTLVSCALFGAICGSATATTATMGTVALPEMRKYKYKSALSTGVISVGGTLGIMIPPSVVFIVYGTLADTSIGALFASGIIPGIIITVLFIIAVAVVTKIDPEAGPMGEKFTLKEKVVSLKGCLPFVILFILVLGGIFAGFFTASEGGAIGAFVSFIFLILRRKANLKTLFMALEDTVCTTAMIFTIMIGAYLFGYFLNISNIPAVLADWAVTSGASPYLVLALILVIFAILGCFIDALPLVVILVPIFLPIMETLGIDRVWFGVLIVMVAMIGLITPPVGMCCYVMAGVAKDVPLTTIFKGIVPFLIALGVGLVIMIAVPNLSTLLPSIFYDYVPAHM